jgi:hypothetical protein
MPRWGQATSYDMEGPKVQNGQLDALPMKTSRFTASGAIKMLFIVFFGGLGCLVTVGELSRLSCIPCGAFLGASEGIGMLGRKTQCIRGGSDEV